MLLSPILISIKVAVIATVFTLVIGVYLARIFTKYNFKGKDLLEVLIILPMIMPPSIIGYGLLILIGKRGIIGKAIFDVFGTSLVFTWAAACLASIIVALPLMYQSCKAAFQSIDHTYENAARTLGASEIKVFWKVTLPLAWVGIVSGIVLSFARALGEFGATLMVAGNIPGKTATIPIALYFAVEGGDTRTANILMGIVVIFSFVLIFTLNSWIRKKQHREKQGDYDD